MILAQFLGETIMLKAFPIADMEGNSDDLGMDLRDYFAAAALQGKLANLNYQQEILDKGQEWILEDIFAWADAMMEARK